MQLTVHRHRPRKGNPMLYFVRMESQEATDPRDPKELMFSQDAGRLQADILEAVVASPELLTFGKLEKILKSRLHEILTDPFFK